MNNQLSSGGPPPRHNVSSSAQDAAIEETQLPTGANASAGDAQSLVAVDTDVANVPKPMAQNTPILGGC